MSKINLLKKNLPKILALIVTLLTISASTAGAVKLTQSFVAGDDEEMPKVLAANDSQNENGETEMQTESSQFSGESNAGGNVATPKAFPTSSPEPTKKPLGNLTGSNLSPITSTPGVNTASTNSSACIITLFGSQYDVTSLRSSHPGGDVFVCGADNSAAYQGAHGTKVSRMQAYLVNSQGTTTGNTSGSTSGTPGTNGGYEDEDEEYEMQKQELEDEFERAKEEMENEHEDEDD